MRYQTNETVRFTWQNQNYEADVLISYHEDSETPSNIEGWEVKQIYNITRKRLIWKSYLNHHYELKKALDTAITNHEPTEAPYAGAVQEA